jgi:hypothetical protein
MVFWALVIFSFTEPVVIINIMETREQCEIVRKEYSGSRCHPFKFLSDAYDKR